MRAKSLQAWANTPAGQAANMEVVIHQTLENTHDLYHFGVHLYNFIQKRLPLTHHLYFHYLDRVPHFKTPRMIYGRKRFTRILQQHRPDIVLSTHPHLNHGFFQLAKEATEDRPPLTVTYCGELHGTYGFSHRWVNPNADHFIGAVFDTCKAANQLHMPKDRNHNLGFLLRPHFYETPLTQEQRHNYLRNELHLDPETYTIILGTGANAANNHLPLLNAIGATPIKNIQIVVLCAHNSLLFQSVEDFRHSQNKNKIISLSYLENPSLLLQSADVLLCRPGTGLTSEAILSGIPILHNTLGGTMPQEAITLAYCKQHQLSHQISKPSQLPEIIQNHLQHPEQLQQTRQNLQKVRPTHTPADIIQHLKGWHLQHTQPQC